VILVVGVAIFADFIAPFDPDRIMGEGYQHLPPGGEFILGTDHLGRDVFSRLVYGTRIALEIGLLLVAVEASIGVTLGLIAGYYGGKADELVMRMVDVALSFPGLVLAIAFVGFFGPGLRNLVIALSLTGWAAFARITRAQALAIKEEPYVESARAIGEKDRTIVFKYILPNSISPLIVIATMTLPAAILLAASMSYLGVGVLPTESAWGIMLSDARDPIVDGMWWPAVFPGLAIIVTVLGFNFLGDALRDALDPGLREYKYV
jgi:peptide/nickel transport system permease protein